MCLRKGDWEDQGAQIEYWMLLFMHLFFSSINLFTVKVHCAHVRKGSDKYSLLSYQGETIFVYNYVRLTVMTHFLHMEKN